MRPILFSFFLAISFSIYGQSITTKDEVFKDNPHSRLKVDTAIKEINELTRIKVDTALIELEKLIVVYKLDGFDYAYARALSLKSWYLNYYTKYEEGLKLGHEALDIQRDLGDSLGIGMTYNRLGMSNLYFERNKEARKYFKQSKELFTLLRDTNQLDMVINNLGVLSNQMGEKEQAIFYYQQSKSLREKKNKQFWVAYSYYNIASVYSNTEKNDSISKYFDLAVQTFKNKTESGYVPAMIYAGIAAWNVNTENYEAAVKNAHLALEKAEVKNNKEMIFHATNGLVRAYSGLGDYEKAFNYQTSAFEQQLRIDSLNNVVKVSEIEEKFNNSENLREIAVLENENLANENRIQDLYMIALYFAIALISAAPISIIIYQRNKQKRALQKETANKQQAEMKLMALQSQMNPHFIFNCINTAQSFMLNDNKQATYVYLSNFAKLLRSVLIHSSQAYIPLEDEIAQLKIYIELEAIRFDENFDFDIEVDPALEQGIFEVPGMIIQSFVENAILHGLNNLKSRHGNLLVRFEMENDLLKCEIHDNGIGRKAALAIKEKKKAHYPSAALPNISERIRLLRDITNREVNILIEDLQENGTASGTVVRLYLPIQ